MVWPIADFGLRCNRNKEGTFSFLTMFFCNLRKPLFYFRANIAPSRSQGLSNKPKYVKIGRLKPEL
jgi:hypothetical protein